MKPKPTTVRQRITLAMIGTFGLGATACSFDSSDLTIKNGSKYRVSELSIADGRKTWDLGSLDPGVNVKFEHALRGEAEASISWSLQGKRHSKETCYYTGGMPLRGTITIVNDHLEYRC
jgi:hypothetical protein